MTDQRTIWLAAASGVISHRRMYAIATEIAADRSLPSELHRAALKVVRVLDGVINLPIADNKVLAKANRKFGKTIALLERMDTSEPYAVRPKRQRPVERIDYGSASPNILGHHCFPARFRHVFLAE